MNNYFTACKTQDEAKNTFRKLCMIMHPDKGGKHSDFIELMQQFEAFRPTAGKQEDGQPFNASKFYDMIQNFESLEGLNISFVGSWIWLEGETMQHREAIKKITLEGYKAASWAKIKKAWFFSPLDYVKKGKPSKGLEEIKNLFGCKTFKTKTTLKLAY